MIILKQNFCTFEKTIKGYLDKQAYNLSHRLGWDENMLFTPDIDIFGEKLEVYRNCFSKPQWRHFKTYMNGLVVSEKGEKNIQDIAFSTL